jgi:hypothetical protein
MSNGLICGYMQICIFNMYIHIPVLRATHTFHAPRIGRQEYVQWQLRLSGWTCTSGTWE